jgi:sporulation protein YlmC with PRC-barrel domain
MGRKIITMAICLTLLLTGQVLAQKPKAKEPTPKQPAAQTAPATPVAGVQPVALGVTMDELVVVAKGWSAKKQLLGKQVLNDKNQKVGKIDDLIISQKDKVTYAIIGAGGFLGVDRHDVAIPMGQLKIDQGKIVLPGATKAAIKAMPKFKYGK